VVGVPEENEETVAAFALADDVQDLVGDAFGSAARQGDEEATGGEVAAEGEHGHGRTALDFLLAREHAVPVQCFVNPNVRGDLPTDKETLDSRPVLAELGGVEAGAATINPGNIGQIVWHCSFSYDNDAKRVSDRDRVYMGDRADYERGRTMSRNWGGEGQCLLWTDQHARFVRTKSLPDQYDPNIYHHNEFGGEGSTEVVNGVAVTRATIDTHLRFFSEDEDDVLLPN